MTRLLALPCLLVALAACAPGRPDAPGEDGEGSIGEETDAGETVDTDAGAPDAGSPDATHLTLTTTNGAFTFDVSASGITFGDETTPDSLYAEAWHGGFTGCPSQASPTPDRTLIFSGISLGSDAPAVQTYDTGARVTLLDFQGDVTADPGPQRATAVTISELVKDGCPTEGDCAGPFSFEVTATLPQGTLSGRVVAERCASLDE